MEKKLTCSLAMLLSVWIKKIHPLIDCYEQPLDIHQTDKTESPTTLLLIVYRWKKLRGVVLVFNNLTMTIQLTLTWSILATFPFICLYKKKLDSCCPKKKIVTHAIHELLVYLVYIIFLFHYNFWVWQSYMWLFDVYISEFIFKLHVNCKYDC